MSRTLGLTSPTMRGEDVRKAQALLAGNDYGRFYGGLEDGEYGPTTAGAVRQAKWVVGYAVSNVNDRYGAAFAALLSGRTKQSPSQRIRAAKRRTDLADDTIGDRAVSAYLRHLGEKEDPPGSNRCWASRWYTSGRWYGPWCAMGVSWAFATAGSKAVVRDRYWAYTPYMVNDARSGRNGLKALARTPANLKTGTIALFDWGHDAVADHVGIVVTETFLAQRYPDALTAARGRFGTLGHGDFWCVEGNTSPDSDSNGGECMLRRRNLTQLVLLAEVTR